MTLLIRCLFLAYSSVLLGSELLPIQDFRTPIVRDLIFTQTLGPRQVREHVLRYLGLQNILLGRAVWYGSALDRRRSAPQGGTDCTIASGLNRIEQARLNESGQRCPSVAFAYKIGTSLIVQELEPSCQWRDIFTTAESPLALEDSLGNLKIVDYSISRRGKDGAAVTFYIMAETEVSEARALTVLNTLKRRTGIGDISVILRKDRYFVAECDFSIIRSVGNGPVSIPEEQLIRSTPQIVCVKSGSWPTQCY